MCAVLYVNQIEQADHSPVELIGQSAAKAWAAFCQRGTFQILDNFNISSLVDYSTDRTQANLINSLNSWYYPVQASGGRYANYSSPDSILCHVCDRTASSVCFTSSYVYGSNTYADSATVACLTLYGDLA